MQKYYKPHGKNHFAEMMYINITLFTSDKPYGIFDGLNPLFQLRKDMFNYTWKNMIHSGHVQTENQDLFFLVKNGIGRCEVSSLSTTLSFSSI